MSYKNSLFDKYADYMNICKIVGRVFIAIVNIVLCLFITSAMAFVGRGSITFLVCGVVCALGISLGYIVIDTISLDVQCKIEMYQMITDIKDNSALISTNTKAKETAPRKKKTLNESGVDIATKQDATMIEDKIVCLNCKSINKSDNIICYNCGETLISQK